MISETNIKMLKLLADVLHDREPESFPDGEWSAVYKEMCEQSVYALPAAYIPSLGLQKPDEDGYVKAVLKNRMIFHTLMRDQKKVLSALEKANIPAVVIKGASAAVNYPQPENRCMGDIDLLVRPSDFEGACGALSSAGYTTGQSPDAVDRHIRFFTDNDIEVELHNHFSSSNDPGQNAVLDKMLSDAIPSRISSELCGYTVSSLPTEENGLVLLAHINQHLSKGLGLRQIIDWMLFAEKHLDDEMWENGFADMADRIGLKRLAKVTTAMCRKYLGLDKDISWCSYEPVCDELMEYILYHGNFGVKVEKNQKATVSVLKELRNPIHGLAVAQSCGLNSWEACKKHRWLRPFAWIYQLGHWTRRSIQRGVTVGALSNASATAKAETELLEKLGVTRM